MLDIYYSVTMNRNKYNEIKDISCLLASENKSEVINNFMIELLTASELETISKRWQILKMLNEGITQREIAKELKVSLCKVTRGSQILKKKNSITNRYLNNKGEIKNEC